MPKTLDRQSVQSTKNQNGMYNDDNQTHVRQGKRRTRSSLSPRSLERRSDTTITQQIKGSYGQPRSRSRSRSPYDRRRKRRFERDYDSDRRMRYPSCDRSSSADIGIVLASESDRGRASRDFGQSSRMPLPSQQTAFRRESDSMIKRKDSVEQLAEKQKPNYGASGKLAAETNKVAGTDIILKYNEPPEARKPPSTQRWMMYVFKGKEEIAVLNLSTRSCWLFGRERTVADCTTEHSSCSKQHAVIQFRFIEKRNEFGDRIVHVKPYIIDLESANGTRVNGDLVPDRRYVELRSGDVIMFGQSSREYVLISPN